MEDWQIGKNGDFGIEKREETLACTWKLSGSSKE